MPRFYKQFAEILALAEGGDLQADITKEMDKVIQACRDAAGAKGSASGSVTLKMNFTVQGVDLIVASNIATTVPKQPRAASHMFISDDGVSREHPKQRNFFDKEDGGNVHALGD